MDRCKERKDQDETKRNLQVLKTRVDDGWRKFGLTFESGFTY